MTVPLIAASGEVLGRATQEWIGKSADDRPPPHVRLRVLKRHSYICHWTKTRIQAGENWDLDHVDALVNGGENRESNMAPIRHGKAHKDKSTRDLEEAARVRQLGSKHYGTKPPSPWSKRYHQTKEWLARKQQSERDA